MATAVLLYRLEPFDPAPFPIDELAAEAMVVPSSNGGMLEGSEKVGAGLLAGPEDIAYDPGSQVIYTGCGDGRIVRVRVNDSTVENWVNTGGRPLGLALGPNNEIIVADALKGLLKVTEAGEVKILAVEAEGLKFKLTDGVDVAHDGMIYFTDASYKYSLAEFKWDLLEGRPHGRLLSFDPSTQKIQILVPHLYFPNGVAVSPDQTSLIFCETFMRRCKRYYLQGEKKGRVEKFVENLPGMPDNIHYDGEGYFWIALAMANTYPSNLVIRYPVLRKIMAMVEKFIRLPSLEKDGGVLEVDLEGTPIAYYHDPKLSMVTSGVKIGNHLYCGSVINPYILRLNLVKYPAITNT